LGDIDDVLIFTARAKEKPYQGRVLGDPEVRTAGRTFYQSRFVTMPGREAVHLIESNYAEIIWWTQWDDVNGNGRRDPGEVTLYRRVLLIRPDITVNTNLVSARCTIPWHLSSRIRSRERAYGA
jgi:hypothetical protein